MKKAAILFSFILCASILYAQDYTFSTLAVKGQVKTLVKGTWDELKPGAKIQKAGKLNVPSGGYVAMIHSTGKTYTLKKEGIYTVKDLEKKLTSESTTGFSEKYTNFVVDNMKGGGSSFKDYSTTGSVHRGSAGTISILGPNVTYKEQMWMLENAPVEMTWEIHANYASKVKSCDVVIKDLYDQEVHRETVSDNKVLFDFKNWGLVPNDNEPYLLVIHDSNDPSISSVEKVHEESTPFYIYKKDSEVGRKYELFVKELNLDSAPDLLVLAAFFDDHKLKLNALEAMRKASELEPEIPFYAETYKGYIEANSLKPQTTDPNSQD